MEQDYILTVSALNDYVAAGLRADPLLSSLRLRGQMSGFKPAASGHWYFTLKDAESAIDCVMFRTQAMRVSFRPKNGDDVIVHGSVGLYTASGRYQMYCDSMRMEGVGSLWRQFEALKEKLQAEGLFDAARKRPLPKYPRKIAVVTSESGAVWHDIRHVAYARDPQIQLELVPVPVQGEGAAEQIAEGLFLAGRLPGVDLVIVGRGGGSMEDLWCFNEECVARAIAACPVPVISAVGHETDFTIADFAADARAATPSNAAEMAVPEKVNVIAEVQQLRSRLAQAMVQIVQAEKLRLQACVQLLAQLSPAADLREKLAAARELKLRLDSAARKYLQSRMPEQAMLALRLESSASALLERRGHQLRQVCARLEAISPQRVLERGYAMVTADGTDAIVTSAGAAPKRMRLHFADGTVPVVKEDGE